MVEKFWTLTDRQICDCEMILDKSFHPLNRFMTEEDYNSVLNEMRLSGGQLFPIPVTLDVKKEFFDQLEIGEQQFFVKKRVLKLQR